MLQALELVPQDAKTGSGRDLVILAACKLIAACAAPDATASPPGATFIDAALKRPNDELQAAGARAQGALSRGVDASALVKRHLSLLDRSSAAQQQSSILVLGAIDYRGSTSSQLPAVLGRLLTFTDERKSIPPKPVRTIEARRNAFRTLASLATEPFVGSVAIALVGGMDDYRQDQRGDVGSWVRIVCMVGFVDLLAAHGASVPMAAVESMVGAILKQAVERIDAVREVAGAELARLGTVLPSCASLSGIEALRPIRSWCVSER